MLHGGSKQLDRGRTRHSQVTHFFFEGCTYYAPRYTKGADLHMLHPVWISESRVVSNEQSRREIREIVRTTVPAEATVLVVSRGDAELLDLDGRRGWHFPQDEEGAWAGYYPGNSAAAVAHLESLRVKGGRYLLFPADAFWWLDHYSEFRQYLEGRYRTVAREENCLIFALDRSH
jgi:hypothetical protein